MSSFIHSFMHSIEQSNPRAGQWRGQSGKGMESGSAVLRQFPSPCFLLSFLRPKKTKHEIKKGLDSPATFCYHLILCVLEEVSDTVQITGLKCTSIRPAGFWSTDRTRARHPAPSWILQLGKRARSSRYVNSHRPHLLVLQQRGFLSPLLLFSLSCPAQRSPKTTLSCLS